MAIEKKRMRQRRGPYSDYDPLKALAQEIQVVTSGDPNTSDGKAIYVAVVAGDLRRLITGDELDSKTAAMIQAVFGDIEPYLKNAQAATTYANNAGTYANTQSQAAEAAAAKADDVAENLIAMRDSGAFKGETGDMGPPGPKGESGVMVPTAGMFSLELDSETGDLYAVYPDETGDIGFDYDSDSGDLWAVIGE